MKLTAINRIVKAIGLVVFFSKCASISSSKTKGLNLIVNYPVLELQDKHHFSVSNLMDTVKIYYINDCIVYGLIPPRDFETNKKVELTGEIFIYRRGEKTGILYPSINSEKGETAQVDSVLFKKAFTGTKFIYPVKPWIKVDSSKNGDEVIEKFAYSIKGGNYTIPDTIIYNYSKDLSEYPYTFSSEIDRLMGMKLNKIKFLFNKKVDVGTGLEVPEREIYYAIQKRDIIASDSIISHLLSKFEKAVEK
jgi:hypothetical protein